jgi:transcriptional regulator with XRE-family HTH domain
MLNLQVKDALRTSSYAVFMQTMGDRIKILREAKNLTQFELGGLCGVTKSAVSQWEDGRTANIKLASFLKLVEALGTDTHYLIWGNDRAPAGRAAAPIGAAPSSVSKLRKPGDAST